MTEVPVDKAAVQGQWSEWGSWSQCSQTCGTGTRQRQRRCSDPAPANGRADCEGLADETSACAEWECPGKHNPFIF